jgi:hypothetical protein
VNIAMKRRGEGEQGMEHKRQDQETTIPTIALDQDERTCIQEILTMYASALQLLPASVERVSLFETIQRLQTKLEALAKMQEHETLDIDMLSNHALQAAFAFYLHTIPLFHLDTVQEQDVINGVRCLQAYLRVEHTVPPEGVSRYTRKDDR